MCDIADIFAAHADEVQQHRLSPVQRKALFDIIACRTPLIGRCNNWYCPKCGDVQSAWVSCGNRNCPKCGRDKAGKYLERERENHLPVEHFMITITLPHECIPAFKAHTPEMAGTFFHAAKDAIMELARDKRHLGAKVGVTAVLQTWSRNGNFHPHLHCLVPGGGLSPDGKYWIWPKKRTFLLPAKPLGKLFRGKFRAELEARNLLGQVPSSIWSRDWVVDCMNAGYGMQSMMYIVPYLFRGFLGNERIVSYDGSKVTFSYKEGGTGRTMHRTLSAVDFIMLYLSHVMPSGMQRIRRYGLLANACKAKLKELRLRILCAGACDAQISPFQVHTFNCKKCGTPLLSEQAWKKRQVWTQVIGTIACAERSQRAPPIPSMSIPSI